MALLLCLALSGCVEEEWDPAQTQQRGQFAANKIQATLASADLMIKQDASAQEISVQVRAYADADAADIYCEGRDGTVWIEQRSGSSWGGHGRLEIDVTVPDKQLDTVDLYTASGDVELQGVAMRRGYIETASGDADLTDVAAQELEIATVSGEQELVRIAAQVLEVHSTSGELTGRQVATGTLTAHTTSGEMRWDDLAAQTVEMQSVSGELYAVFASSAQHLQARMKSVSGDICCVVPQDLALRISANRTVDGGVHSDERAQNTLTLSTVSGSLKVQAR